MPDFQNIVVGLIVAVAAGWLAFRFRSKKTGSCNTCDRGCADDQKK